MEEPTTNAAEDTGAQAINGIPVDDQGQAVAEPVETDTATAESTTQDEQAETEQVTESESQETDNSDEDAAWAKNKGLSIETDNERKLAQMARNAEKAMHEKSVKASQLEKAIDTGITQEAEAQGLTGDDRVEIARIKVKMNVREFFEDHPEAKAYEQAMATELSAKPHLAGDLESLYATAIYKSGHLQNQGKKQALESLVHKQQAAVPKGNAINGNSMGAAKITSQNVDQLVGQNDLNWFREHQAEINQAMAG